MANTNTVIEFPKDRSRRQRRFLFAQQQKNVFALSLLSVFVVSVMINQYLVGQQASQSRQIASLQPINHQGHSQWDQKMAQLISHAPHGKPADEPNLKDEILFGVFKGNYHLNLQQGKVETITLNENALSQGIELQDQAEFLNRFSSVFSKTFTQAVLNQQSATASIYQLINDAGEVVGTAKIETNDQGLVQKLSIQ